MKSTTLIALTACSALLTGITVANAQNDSTSSQNTSPSVKSHASRVHAHPMGSTTGVAVGDPDTTQRDKNVNYWATHNSAQSDQALRINGNVRVAVGRASAI